MSSGLKLTEEQQKLLHKLYYEEKLFVGRDRLFQFIRSNYRESGISRRDVMRWLKEQKPWQLTKLLKKRAHTSMMDIKKPGYMCCDLAGPIPRDKQKNYIFILVDTASRMTYAKAIKDASAKASVQALEQIIKENPDMKLTLCRSDNGSSFQGEFTDYLRSIGVKQLFSTPASSWENSRAERTIGVMKAMLTKNEIATGSKAWVKVLPKFIENINMTVNRSMKMTPNEAKDGLPRDVNEDRSRHYGVQKKHLSTKSTFKVGDQVRLRLRGQKFKQKTFWSEEIYIVMKVVRALNSRLVTYKISKDGMNVEKPGYNVTDLLFVPDRTINVAPEVSEEDAAVGERTIHDQREVDDLLINQPEVSVIRESRHPEPDEQGYFELEAILAKRKFGKTVKYLCKWLGYPKEMATWEPARNIKAPELLKEFREKQKKKKK